MFNRLPARNPDGTTPLPRHRASWRRTLWPAYARYLARSKDPILVGPWRGEIGFEALYWIPWVEQFAHDYGIAPERLIPISRGGAAIWYGMPHGFELLEMRTPQQIRLQVRIDVAKTGMFKQNAPTAFDRAIVTDAAETLKLKKYHVIHPAWMYHSLADFWTGHRGIEWIGPQLRMRTIEAPPLPDGMTLPKHFIAVKFYSRLTFPGSHKFVHKFLDAAMAQMSQDAELIVLDAKQHLDDHSELTRGYRGARIHHLDDLMEITPANNLLAQSAILGRSMGFVGTYGGFAQLALRMGKPSTSFYLDWGHATSVAHRALADVLSIRTGIPSIVIKLSELPMLSTVLPQSTVPEVEVPKFNAAAKMAEGAGIEPACAVGAASG
jgi:hypothetical protein